LLIVIVFWASTRSFLYRNLAYVSFSKALAADHIRATERQKGLTRFLEYLRSDRDQEILLPESEDLTEKTMLQSIFIGQYYRFQGNEDEAANWYLKAIDSDPVPFWQDSLVWTPQHMLLPDGYMLIHDFSQMEGWKLASPTNVVDVTFESVDGIALMTYPNRSDQRDRAAYALYLNPVPLSYHTVLVMRVKIEPGAFLTMVTKKDGILERHLDYYQGSGDWETLRFPLTGDELQMVKLIPSEPAKPKMASVYKIWFDWIKLELASK
jgi:tetratricopeptide (TPR) repeat protein